MDTWQLERVDVTSEVNRWFDDDSRACGAKPELALVTGGVAVGKSRLRRELFARGFVTLDAGEIFIRLSHGRHIAFPDFLAEPMDMIGSLIAWQAVQERRNIVCELIAAEPGPIEQLIETYRAIGYYISATGVRADLEQSLRWNQERSDDNISAYYTEPIHHRWLLSAAETASNQPGRR